MSASSPAVAARTQIIGISGLGGLEPAGRTAVQVLEQAGASAEEPRNDVNVHLVHEPSSQVLLRRAGTAAE